MLRNTSLKLALFAACTLVAFTGCSKDPKQPNVEVIQGMMEQPALKAQDFHPSDREKGSMLVPPKGTWPKNVKPYLYRGKPGELAGEKLKNPFAGNGSKEILSLGMRHFNNFCVVCHGEKGQGDGPVAPKFGMAVPDLTAKKVIGYRDGQIFHVITDGQGLMKPYIHQLPGEKDRWAVVQYVRELQKLRGN